MYRDTLSKRGLRAKIFTAISSGDDDREQALLLKLENEQAIVRLLPRRQIRLHTNVIVQSSFFRPGSGVIGQQSGRKIDVVIDDLTERMWAEWQAYLAEYDAKPEGSFLKLRLLAS